MRYAELTRKLRRLGCELYRQRAGSHEMWVNDKGESTTIPNWGSKDLRAGTLHRILRDLGISRDDFNKA